jgi:hypothetical protein
MTEISAATRAAVSKIRGQQKLAAETRAAVEKLLNPKRPPPTVSQLQAASLLGLDDNAEDDQDEDE